MAFQKRLLQPQFLFGTTIAFIVISCAFFAPWLAPHEPNEQDLLNMLIPPAWVAGGNTDFYFGTDSLGRDTLSRLIWGARVAMEVALLASAGAAILGTTLACLAGYFGGRIDWAIGRFVEIWLSFPPVVLSLLLIVGLGVGTDKVILAIILVDWTRFCRVLRNEVQGMTRKDYVRYANLIGFSHARVILREILPGILPMIITLFSLQMGISVVVEAILSYLGMGVSSDVSAWGQMIADARIDVYSAPWGLFLPIAAIFFTVLGFNLLGEGLRHVLDPRQTARRQE